MVWTQEYQLFVWCDHPGERSLQKDCWWWLKCHLPEWWSYLQYDQQQGQPRPTLQQSGSSVQNKMYWLSGYLSWGDWQKCNTTEWPNGDIRNRIAEHHRLTKHNIDWDSAGCVTYMYSTNYQWRLTLGSWYSNLEQDPLNWCQKLPAPYKQLIQDLQTKPTNFNKQ